MKIAAYVKKIKEAPKKYPVLGILINKYVLILLVFIVWMLFLDTNSFLIHHELNSEIEALEDNKNYYQKEIDKDQNQINALKDSTALEKFAREEYFMKKENEEIYIIEYEDSLK